MAQNRVWIADVTGILYMLLLELVNSALSKPDIIGSVILSSENSIGICFNVQGKSMT